MNADLRFQIAFHDLLAREGIEGEVARRQSVSRPKRKALIERFGEQTADSLIGEGMPALGIRAKWWRSDDPDSGGALGTVDADQLLENWCTTNPDFDLSGRKYHVADFHNDDAMAFVLEEGGVVAARAGEEAQAVHVASTLEGYIDKACEARFVHYWALPGSRLANDKTPEEVREEVLALPYRKDVSCRVEDVVPLSGADVVAFWFEQLNDHLKRKALDVAGVSAPAGEEGRALAAFLARPEGRVPWSKVAKALSYRGPARKAAEYKKAFGFEEDHVALVWQGDNTAVSGSKLSALLDIPGADALANELGDDLARVRFAPWGDIAARVFAFEDTAPGSDRHVCILPARLLPTGAAKGKSFGTFAAGWTHHKVR